MIKQILKKRKNTSELLKLSALEELNDLKTKVIQLQDDKITLQEKTIKLQEEKIILLQEKEKKHGRKTIKNNTKTRN